MSKNLWLLAASVVALSGMNVEVRAQSPRDWSQIYGEPASRAGMPGLNQGLPDQWNGIRAANPNRLVHIPTAADIIRPHGMRFAGPRMSPGPFGGIPQLVPDSWNGVGAAYPNPVVHIPTAADFTGAHGMAFAGPGIGILPAQGMQGGISGAGMSGGAFTTESLGGGLSGIGILGGHYRSGILGGGVPGMNMLGDPGVNSQPLFAGFQGNQPPVGRPGIGPDPNSPPGPRREFKPEALNEQAIKQLMNPRFETGPPSKYLGERESPKVHEWKWPAWVCWQSALGIFALCFVIGLLSGRFGPSD